MTPTTVTPAEERHYSVNQVAELWGIGDDTVRRLFEDIPGVLKISQPTLLKRKRAPRTMLRIPASVLEAAHQQWSGRGGREVKRGGR
jgi:hypothetical protein